MPPSALAQTNSTAWKAQQFPGTLYLLQSRVRTAHLEPGSSPTLIANYGETAEITVMQFQYPHRGKCAQLPQGLCKH